MSEDVQELVKRLRDRADVTHDYGDATAMQEAADALERLVMERDATMEAGVELATEKDLEILQLTYERNAALARARACPICAGANHAAQIAARVAQEAADG